MTLGGDPGGESQGENGHLSEHRFLAPNLVGKLVPFLVGMGTATDRFEPPTPHTAAIPTSRGPRPAMRG